jgi:hypothetical protein
MVEKVSLKEIIGTENESQVITESKVTSKKKLPAIYFLFA